jgi:hypothetical protein
MIEELVEGRKFIYDKLDDSPGSEIESILQNLRRSNNTFV